MKDKKLRWQNTEEFLDQLTYNPPPVLAQTYPPGALRGDDRADGAVSPAVAREATKRALSAPSRCAGRRCRAEAVAPLRGTRTGHLAACARCRRTCRWHSSPPRTRRSPISTSARSSRTGRRQRGLALPPFEPNAGARVRVPVATDEGPAQPSGCVVPLAIAATATVHRVERERRTIGAPERAGGRRSRRAPEVSPRTPQRHRRRPRRRSDPGAALAAKPPNRRRRCRQRQQRLRAAPGPGRRRHRRVARHDRRTCARADRRRQRAPRAVTGAPRDARTATETTSTRVAATGQRRDAQGICRTGAR